MLDRRPARVTGRQVPPLHLRRGSGSGAIFKELPTNSADEAEILVLITVAFFVKGIVQQIIVTIFTLETFTAIIIKIVVPHIASLN